mmetsp:Transcript_33978/g.88617  ORF Transcript_33978/g.88617 Transcript_33978/m.88617 type:complete len:275 (+) Transcript_33978:1399-2223(+)
MRFSNHYFRNNRGCRKTCCRPLSAQLRGRRGSRRDTRRNTLTKACYSFLQTVCMAKDLDSLVRRSATASDAWLDSTATQCECLIQLHSHRRCDVNIIMGLSSAQKVICRLDTVIHRRAQILYCLLIVQVSAVFHHNICIEFRVHPEILLTALGVHYCHALLDLHAGPNCFKKTCQITPNNLGEAQHNRRVVLLPESPLPAKLQVPADANEWRAKLMLCRGLEDVVGKLNVKIEVGIDHPPSLADGLVEPVRILQSNVRAGILTRRSATQHDSIR